MQKTEILDISKKVGRIACCALGFALAVYNFSAVSFTVRGHYFFKDTHQLWFAVGVTLVVLAWLIRDWKK